MIFLKAKEHDTIERQVYKTTKNPKIELKLIEEVMRLLQNCNWNVPETGHGNYILPPFLGVFYSIEDLREME